MGDSEAYQKHIDTGDCLARRRQMTASKHFANASKTSIIASIQAQRPTVRVGLCAE
jgi:hypothetical protein